MPWIWIRKSKPVLKIIAGLLFIAVSIVLAGCSATRSVQDSIVESISPEPAKTSPAPSPSPEQKPDDSNSAPEDTPKQRELTASAVESEPVSQPDYASTTNSIFDIAGKMQKVIADLAPTDVRHAPGGFGDPVYASGYKVFMSFFLTNTRDLNEDQASMDGVLYQWKEKFGCKDAKFFHDAPHNYRLTGTWPQSNDTFEIRCQYDPDTGALQVLCNENGKLRDSVEFKPLGNGRFALQHYNGSAGYEKALITYRDSEIIDFHYVSLFMVSKYRCIYPDGQGLDTAWLNEDGDINYIAEIIYDGNELTYRRLLNA